MFRHAVLLVAGVLAATVSAGASEVTEGLRGPRQGGAPQPPDDAGIRALGWEPAADATDPGPWLVRRPALPLADGLRLLRDRPVDFPRPVAVREDVQLMLPVEALIARLERAERDGQRVVTWRDVPVAVRDLRGPAAVARLREDAAPDAWSPWSGLPPPDAHPGRPRARLSTGWAPPRRRVVWARDPRRRDGPDPKDVNELLDPRVGPVVVAERSDVGWPEGVVVTPDLGTTWARLSLRPVAPGQPIKHELTEDGVLAATGPDGVRVFVAPRPLGAIAALELLELDPQDLSVTSLGRLGPEAGSWLQCVTDVRLAEGDSLEAIVLVHDVYPRAGDEADSWGVVVRGGGDEPWRELGRFALPTPDPRWRVTFAEDGASLELRHGDALRGRQAGPGPGGRGG